MMMKSIKSFRLLNQRELSELTRLFSENLLAWNRDYALLPLSASVRAKPEFEEQHKKLFLCHSEDQDIGVLACEDLLALQECLFADSAACFLSVTTTLLITFIEQLLGISEVQLETLDKESHPLQEWFYHGSPAVAVDLTSGSKKLSLYLHPQWVLKHITKPMQSLPFKVDLNEAFGSQELSCSIELNPFMITVKDTLNLQIGDVIKTDHLLASPVVLKYQNQVLCQAEPGKTHPFKSIQLVSSL